MKITTAQNGRVLVEFDSDLVQSIGKKKLLEATIRTDEEGQILIVPRKDPDKRKKTKEATLKLMEKYRHDLTLLKD